MSFKTIARSREAAYMTRFFDVFGAVEERQLRRMFSYLTRRSYGQVLSKMFREGLCYCSDDGTYMAASKLAFQRSDIKSGVMCFWALISIKDKIRDCVAGEKPAIATVLGERTDYDIIPVTADADSIQKINEWRDMIPHRTVRYFVTEDLDATEGIEWRAKNDYVILVGQKGVVDVYEI